VGKEAGAARRAVICDLDGVIWLSDRPIAGGAEAVARVRAAGDRVLFVTNNSFSPVADVEAKLARFGIPAAGDVVTSAQAAAGLVTAGDRVLLAGGPGAAEALSQAGARILSADLDGAEADVVVVGFHRSFDYEGMRRASSAARGGARLIGTNDDATFPTPGGEIPGAGAILAGIAFAAGVEPVVAGKPNPPMADLVRRRLGGVDELVLVGDRLDTDGRFARVLGARFALVLSGVTGAGDRIEPPADLVAADLGAVVDALGYRRQL